MVTTIFFIFFSQCEQLNNLCYFMKYTYVIEFENRSATLYNPISPRHSEYSDIIIESLLRYRNARIESFVVIQNRH